METLEWKSFHFRQNFSDIIEDYLTRNNGWLYPRLSSQKNNSLREYQNRRIFQSHYHFSFASGGDSDTLDYIAYVAKDGAGNAGL